MRLIGNVLWFVLAGFWLALGHVVAGIASFILIITIPFGIASFRIAGYIVWPFGRTVVWRRDAGTASMIGNVLWLVFFGIELALGYLLAGLVLMITIIGIPFGVALWKMVPIALFPLGREVVPLSRAEQDSWGLPNG